MLFKLLQQSCWKGRTMKEMGVPDFDKDRLKVHKAVLLGKQFGSNRTDPLATHEVCSYLKYSRKTFAHNRLKQLWWNTNYQKWAITLQTNMMNQKTASKWDINLFVFRPNFLNKKPLRGERWELHFAKKDLPSAIARKTQRCWNNISYSG